MKMKVLTLDEQEENFKENLTNTSRVKYNLENVTKLDGCEIHHIRPNFDNYYYKEETKKKKIVLHYTVGSIRGDLASLTKKGNHMSVSYVVARNGIIYEIFDPKYWSYHLGRGSIGGNAVGSKESIGIELSNFGPLNLVGDNLETIYSQLEYTNSNGVLTKSPKDIYCQKSNIGLYDVVPGGLRGYEYFASYTDKQVNSTKVLVEYLCNKFNIPKQLIPESNRYDVFSSSNESREYAGICSHINFRKSGKWDVGPNFPWVVFEKTKKIEPEFDDIIHKEPEFDDSIVNDEVNVNDKETKNGSITDVVNDVIGGDTAKKFKWMDIISKIISFVLGFTKKK